MELISGLKTPGAFSASTNGSCVPTVIEKIINNPNTIIIYSVPVKSFVNITVYNVIGKEVVTLVDEEKPAGIYEVEFSAAGGSSSGKDIYSLPSGVYIYRLTASSFTNSKKMMLLK
ncbi:MAG: T9SS type A sorting domain-containing protein [Bacteroidetes bacterium]|nr:T9SS type A sorting domain-containing protein [Bacteroidota bacterium]